MFRYLLYSTILLVVSCSGDTIHKQRTEPSTKSFESICSSSNSGDSLTCTSGESIPLPPTFPYSKDCNQCKTSVINGVAEVKCPNGLEFKFTLIKGDTGASGKDGTSCSVTIDGWVKCTDGASYKLLQGPKGETGEQGPKGDIGATGAKGGSCHVEQDAYGRTIIKCDDGSQQILTSCGGMGCWSFGVTGNVYTIPTTTTVLPNLDAMTPEESVKVEQFNIFDRDWSLGFPNLPLRKEWYAIKFTGFIELPPCKDNTCFFRTTSDDGSRLYIDSILTVNNDGLHAPQQKVGSLCALAGWHPLRLDWFQGPRSQIALALEISTDGGLTYRLVADTELKFLMTP